MDAAIWVPIVGLGGLGLIFGLFLGYAAKKFSVEVDPKVEQIREILPGANCGGCGYPGCSGFAENLVSGKAKLDLCAPGGAAVVQKIAEILGMSEVATVVPVIATVQCRGGKQEAVERFHYHGIQDCVAAQLIDGGSKGCTYGCLGLGSCVKVCPFNAIFMNQNGLPDVIAEKCTGCGLCVKACPRQIITLTPKHQKIYLGCVSQGKGKDVKNVCTVGCTGCGLCSRPKITPSGSIQMNQNLPVIVNPDAADLVNAVEKCPTSSFVVRQMAS